MERVSWVSSVAHWLLSPEQKAFLCQKVAKLMWKWLIMRFSIALLNNIYTQHKRSSSISKNVGLYTRKWYFQCRVQMRFWSAVLPKYSSILWSWWARCLVYIIGGGGVSTSHLCQWTCLAPSRLVCCHRWFSFRRHSMSVLLISNQRGCLPGNSGDRHILPVLMIIETPDDPCAA